MSDDKRKNARLQGRFSDEQKVSRKEKQKRLSEPRDRKDDSTKVKKNDTKPVQAVEGVELQYDKDANDSFAQLEEKKPPLEINKSGEHILSKTENGTSRVIFEPDFIPEEEAKELMDILRNATKWYDKNIIIHGQEVPQPRLVAWYGPFPYAYSGAVLETAEMPSVIQNIKERIERFLGAYKLDIELNSVLLNFYRNEKDSVAWHSDDEVTMGICPTIASVSLGEIRKFQMKAKPHVHDSDANLVSAEYFVNLTPGSLLIMDGSMQKDWKHQVPKEYHDRSARINLTFRTVYPIDKIPPQVPLSKSKTSNNSSSLTTKKIEENKHIFDCKSFPPLGTETTSDNVSQNESTDTNPISLSQNKDNVETCENPENHISDDADDKESTFNAEVQELVSCQNDDAMPHSTDYVATEAAVVGNHQNEFVECDFEELSVDIEQYNTRGNEDEEESSKESTENQEKRKYQLNAEASEFVPKCQLTSDSTETDYSKVTIVKLADMFEEGRVSAPQYKEFFEAIFDKIQRNPNFFYDRDYYEIETLASINNDGTLNERNQRIILTRLCSMIQNVAKIKNRRNIVGRYGSQQNRTPYRDNYVRSRGNFRGSGYKERSFKN